LIIIIVFSITSIH